MGALDGVGEQPVFASYDERADGVFGGVVIDRVATVIEIAEELVPLGGQVMEGAAEERLRGDACRDE